MMYADSMMASEKPPSERPALTRRKRIALEVLGPAPLGVGVLFGPVIVWEVVQIIARGDSLHLDLPRDVFGVAFYVLAAYLMMGLPSILFAVVMECAFVRGLSPRSWWSVGLATSLGGAAGFGVTWIPHACGYIPTKWVTISIYAATGVAVGFILGAIIRWRSALRMPG